MPQLPLFEPAETLLFDDTSGRIVYTPGFVDGRTADAWFRQLRDEVPWKALRRQMYDREVDVPRLIGHYRLGGEAPAPPASILEAARRVQAKENVPFNSVGLNLYRDGRDSVAPHNDHLYEIEEGFPIALLSLGATRRMTIRSKPPAGPRAPQQPAVAPRRVIHLDLEPGSLLVMSYATQIHYTHGVPKTADPVGERISLAFRVKPTRDEPDAAPGLYR